MDLSRHKKTLSFVYDFFVRGECDVSPVPYLPSKTECGTPAPLYFPRTSPEAKGIPSARLISMLDELEHSSRVNMHSLTVLCDGAVISEASAPGYDRRLPHVTYSLCKSVVGLAIGLLCDEGKIDLERPAYRYFPKNRLPARLSARMKAVTVRHLLTMASGVAFAEAGAIAEVDWLRAFFSSDVAFPPGSAFAYNSMNTYVLSALVREITGEGLLTYLRPRLFDPLRIGHVFWEKCPLGIEKGGWGLYIAQEDVAKIAQLCMDGGVFEGKRLLSAAYIEAATDRQMATPTEAGDYDYGYQIWSRRDKTAFLFNGMLGQNAWVCPKNRIIVVMNAGNNEFFQKSSMLAVIEKWLGGDFTRGEYLRRDKRTLRALRLAESHFFSTRAWIHLPPPPSFFARLGARLRGRPLEVLPRLCDKLAGHSYSLQKNNTGLLPVFLRIQQNNHSAGLRAISFERWGERFFVTFDEGERERYRLEAGFYRPIYTTLRVQGESYLIGVQACFATDEDGHRLLKIECLFPEMAHARRIKVFFDDENVTILLRETPGKEVLDMLIRSVSVSAPRAGGLIKFFYNRINFDYIFMKAYDKFEPSFKLSLAEEAQPTVAGLLGTGEEPPLFEEVFHLDTEPSAEEKK